MPSSGVCPSISGVSWFGVERTSSPEPLHTSHVHPEPKRLTPASFSAALSWSASPNASLIAASRSPEGSPPPFGCMICQKSVWFACPPPLLRTAMRLSSGIRSRLWSNCSSGRSAHSVPSSALFRLSTYAWWCLPWWMRIVCSSIVGSRASWSYGRGGSSWGISLSFGSSFGDGGYAPRRPDAARVQPRGDRRPGAEAGALRARRHLARDDRGALPPLPGVRLEAKRDPREARRRRPRLGEPDQL